MTTTASLLFFSTYHPRGHKLVIEYLGNDYYYDKEQTFPRYHYSKKRGVSWDEIMLSLRDNINVVHQLVLVRFPWGQAKAVERLVQDILWNCTRMTSVTIQEKILTRHDPIPDIFSQCCQNIHTVSLWNVARVGRQFCLPPHATHLKLFSLNWHHHYHHHRSGGGGRTDLGRLLQKSRHHLKHLEMEGFTFLYDNNNSNNNNVLLFEDVIQALQHHPCLEYFGIADCNLPESAVARILQYPPLRLQELNVSCRTWSPETVQQLTTLLSSPSCQLVTLIMRHRNRMTNNSSLSMRGSSDNNITVEDDHDNDHHHIWDFITFCEKGLSKNKTLKELDLRFHQFHDKAMELLFPATQQQQGSSSPSCLERLYLESDGFTDTTCALFTQYLPQLPSLKELHLINPTRPFGILALEQLARAIQHHHTTSLEALQLFQPPNYNSHSCCCHDDNDNNSSSNQRKRRQDAHQTIEYYLNLNWGGVSKLLLSSSSSAEKTIPWAVWPRVLARANHCDDLRPMPVRTNHHHKNNTTTIANTTATLANKDKVVAKPLSSSSTAVIPPPSPTPLAAADILFYFLREGPLLKES